MMDRRRAVVERAQYIAEKTDHGAEIIDFYLALARDPNADSAERRAAYDWLDARGIAGKPSERVEIDHHVHDESRALDEYLDRLSLEDQLKLRELIAKLDGEVALLPEVTSPIDEVLEADVIEDR